MRTLSPWQYWHKHEWTPVAREAGVMMLVTDTHSGIVGGRVVECSWTLERPMDVADKLYYHERGGGDMYRKTVLLED